MFAEKVGISPNHVGVIERGETMPSLETVLACAKALSVSIGDLIDSEQPSDLWLKQLTTIAAPVLPARRSLLLSLVTALVDTLSRPDVEVETVALKHPKPGVANLRAQPLDDPKLLVIIEMLRKRTPAELEQALYVLKALEHR